MTRPRYTVALELYDRHVPLFMGLVKPPKNFDLDYLEVGVTKPGRDGTDRHGRMLKAHEFDVAELSLAGYIIAKSRGSQMTAVPVFPRRLFSQNHIYVHRDANIRSPKDLIGRKVAIRAFQVTMSVLARGDLATIYGVPSESIRWVVQRREHQDFDRRGLAIETPPEGRAISDLLLAGDVDALIDPGAPLSVLQEKETITTLFADPRAESLRHFRDRGYYPLMHVVALRPGIAETEPDLPAYLFSSWDEAKTLTRHHQEDFAFPLAPFGRYAIEEDEARFGSDPWPSGLSANRGALKDFIDYLRAQGLIDRSVAPEELFHASVLGT